MSWPTIGEFEENMRSGQARETMAKAEADRAKAEAEKDADE